MSSNKSSKSIRVDSSNEANTILKNADAQASSAERIIGEDSETLTAGRSQLIKALKQAVDAAKSYDKLMDMAPDTNGNKTMWESLDQKLQKTLATGIRINNALVLQNAKSKIPGFELVNLADKLNTDSDEYDDLEEVRKRVKSFEKFPCDSRTLDDFPGGKQYEELLLKNFILTDIKYTNLKNETRSHPVQPILVWGPSGAGKMHLVDAFILKIQNMKEYANRKIPVFNVSGRMVIGKHNDLESTEKMIRVLFDEARKQVRAGLSIIFIKESEYAFVSKQEKSKEVGNAIAALTAECSKESNKGIILMMTTSFPETLDYSIIDLCLNRIVYVGHPTGSNIKEFLINKFKSLGVGRYHTEFNLEYEAEYGETGTDKTKRLKPIELFKPSSFKAQTKFDGDMDILDFLSTTMLAQKYLVREIDAIWSRALEFAQLRTTNFLESETKNGSNDQRWIRDERKKKIKVTDTSGKCSEREVIRSAFIPVGTEGVDFLFSPDQVIKNPSKKNVEEKNEEDDEPLADWDVKEITENKNLFRVVTRRQRNSNDKWEYLVIREEFLNSKGVKEWKEFAGREIPNFLDLVGMSQLRFKDIEDAIDSIKPVKIPNVDELLAFSKRSLFVKSKTESSNGIIVPLDLYLLQQIQKEQKKAEVK